MISVTLLVVALVLIAIGLPVAFAIGIGGLIFFLLPGGFMPDVVAAQRIVASSQSFPLLAIPMFILVGHLLNASGITRRLIHLSTVLAGWMRGGLAQASTVLSALMGGISGSAVADAAMQVRVLGKPMIDQGYSPGFTAAVIAVGGLITATLPPSLGLILYGYLGEVSIGRLFIGGIVPGFLLLFLYLLTVAIMARARGYKAMNPRLPRAREVLSATYSSFWALIFPVWLIVGIRFGIFTPSEAGAFAVVYACFVGFFIYREMTISSVITALNASVRDIGMILSIILFSGALGYVISFDRLPQSIAELSIGLTSSPSVLLVMVCVFLVVFGMFIEATVVVLLLTPILVPVVTSAGVDPVHFGLIMMTLVTFGGMTPPVGVSMFAVCGILNCSYLSYTRELLPFVVATFFLVALMIVFPSIVLFLPNYLMG